MTAALEQYGVNLAQAAATGVASYAISYVVSSDKMPEGTGIVSMNAVKMAAVSAGSEAVAAIATNQLLPTLMGMSSMDGATLSMYTRPIVSGLVYHAASKSLVSGLDERPFLEKFLSQVGASVVAGYVMAPALYTVASD